MNKRLKEYLRSIGLASDANDAQEQEFFASLRGLPASIANALNYSESDSSARTNCDLMIRALGYDPANPANLLPDDATTEERTLATAGTDGASLAGDLESAEERGAEREATRRASIRQLGAIAGSSAELMQRLESDTKITVAAASEQIFKDHQERTRATVPADMPGRAPAGHTANSQTDFGRESLACAVMMRQGINDPTRGWSLYDDITGTVQTVDRTADDTICRAAERGHQLRRLSTVELVRQAMALDGIEVAADPAAIGRAMQQRGAAAMSTSALVGIYTQTMGALLLQAFNTTADTTQGWTIERENPNYLQNERHRMARGAALTRHAKGGTAEDIEIQEALTEYVKVFKYTGKFVIDEQDLVNDTFGALNQFTPEEMGEAARRLGPDLVYAILLSNPALADTVALFHSDHSNLGSSALTKAGLETALNGVSTQQENGVNLNLEARYLIVPRALRFTAKELIRSQTVVVRGDTDSILPSANALVDEDLQVVSDSRLDNGVTDPQTGVAYSGDTNDWYVSCPGSRHTIEKTYLRGSSRSPEMRSGVLDRGQFGIWFDIAHTIGAKALAYQGIRKHAVT